MASLVTLEQAKAHLRLSGVDHEDDDLLLKIRQAQAVVIDYISDSTNSEWTAELAAWTDETVPPAVQAAILIQVKWFYRFRGDDPRELDPKDDNGDLAPGVKACLYRRKRLVIA